MSKTWADLILEAMGKDDCLANASHLVVFDNVINKGVSYQHLGIIARLNSMPPVPTADAVWLDKSKQPIPFNLFTQKYVYSTALYQDCCNYHDCYFIVRLPRDSYVGPPRLVKIMDLLPND